MSTNDDVVTYTLDCCGLSCPMPIVKIGQILQKMKVGDLLDISADDLAFEDDMRAFIGQINQEIVKMDKHGENVHVIIKKIC